MDRLKEKLVNALQVSDGVTEIIDVLLDDIEDEPFESSEARWIAEHLGAIAQRARDREEAGMRLKKSLRPLLGSIKSSSSPSAD